MIRNYTKFIPTVIFCIRIDFPKTKTYGYTDSTWGDLLTSFYGTNIAYVANQKRLIIVFEAAKPPKATSKPSRVYRGESLRLCDGGAKIGNPLNYSNSLLDRNYGRLVYGQLGD